MIAEVTALKAKVDDCIDKTQLQNALIEIFKVVSRANKYIDETTPWVLAKDEANKIRLATVLYNLLDTIRVVATLLSAFMPTTMPKALEQIGACEKCASYETAGKFGALPLDVTVKKGEALFPRIDVEKEIEELNAIIKSDIRVGEVKACEKVKKSKKLLQFSIFDGADERTIVSGIAKYYKPEELVGKKILFVSNLKPVKLCGIESHGMILSAVHGEGDKEQLKLVIVGDDMPAGWKVS